MSVLQLVALRLLFASSYADGKLPSPALLSGVVLAVYVVWLPFGAAFSLLAYGLTTPGVLLVSLVCLVIAGRTLARALVFPASLAVLRAGMDGEYAARMRVEVVAGLKEAEAFVLAFAVLERRAASPGGALTLPPQLAALLTGGTPPPAAVGLQPGPNGALSLDNLIRSLEACEGEDAPGPHAALLLHYAVCGRELARCAGAAVAAALAPSISRDAATTKAVASRLTQLSVVWRPAGSAFEEPDDLLTGEHGVNAATVSACAALAAADLTETLLSHAPPAPEAGQAVLAVKQALAAGQDNGSPLTVKLVLLASLACYNRLRSLLPWLQAVPHYGPGSGRARRIVAALVRPALPADAVVACIDASNAAWWRDHMPDAVASRLGLPIRWTGFAVPPPSNRPTVGARLGLPDACALAAKAALDAVLAGGAAPLWNAPADSMEEGGTRAHPAAPILVPGVPAAGSTAGADAGGPLTVVTAGLREMGKAAASALDGVWHALTVTHASAPVLGPSFLRCELQVRAAARQVWIAAPRGGLQKLLEARLPPHQIDALVIPSAATASAWSGAAVVKPLTPAALGGSPVEDAFALLVAEASPAEAPPAVEEVGVATFRLHAPVVVILCAPNAGRYEHALRHNDWCSVYGSAVCGSVSPVVEPSACLGADVILWNYRGVGRSMGSPTMRGMQTDITAIIAWARRHASPSARVVVHGESLGGLAACWVGGQGGADAIVADRTFSSLPAMAQVMMGTWAAVALASFYPGLRVVSTTAWMGRAGSASPLVPRLLLSDPADGVIAWKASLAADVALKMVMGKPRALGDENGDEETPKGVLASIGAGAKAAGRGMHSAVVGAGRGVLRSFSRLIERGADAGDHSSDAPPGGAEQDAVADEVASVAISVGPPTSQADLLRRYQSATGHLHYFLLHMGLVTVGTFARSQLEGAGLRVGAEEATSSAPAVDIFAPQPVEAPPTPVSARIPPSASALTALLSGRGLGDLPRASPAYAAAVDEAYGGVEGRLRGIVGMAILTAGASCSKAEGLVSAAVANGVFPLSAAVGTDSGEFSGRFQATFGAGAVTAVLAGITNGVGQTLAEAVAPQLSDGPLAGLAATRSWAAAGLVWGWVAQAGRGPLAEVAAGMRPSPRPGAGTPFVLDTPLVGLGKPTPYLEAHHETGLESARRRLQAMLASALSSSGASQPPARAGPTVPTDTRVLQEAIAVVTGLQELQAAWVSSQPPEAATLAGALCSRAGVLVPLSCGHNMPLSARESSVVISALRTL